MYCNNCGRKVTSGKFCPNCGADLNVEATPVYKAQQTLNSQTALIIIIVVIVIAAICIGVYVKQSKETPSTMDLTESKNTQEPQIDIDEEAPPAPADDDIDAPREEKIRITYIEYTEYLPPEEYDVALNAAMEYYEELKKRNGAIGVIIDLGDGPDYPNSYILIVEYKDRIEVDKGPGTEAYEVANTPIIEIGNIDGSTTFIGPQKGLDSIIRISGWRNDPEGFVRYDGRIWAVNENDIEFVVWIHSADSVVGGA